jgi:hypothetical protein
VRHEVGVAETQSLADAHPGFRQETISEAFAGLHEGQHLIRTQRARQPTGLAQRNGRVATGRPL